MLRDGVLVRRLVGIETAGNMSILFTDKTGTLTTGKMTVEKLITIDNTYCSYKHLSENKFLRDKFSTVCDAVCGTGKVSSTENAVLKFFHYEKKRNDNIQRIPFNSKTKVSKGIVSGKTYCMGAPEKLLKGVKY